MPHYRIQPGGSFRLPDNSLKTAGDDIELDQDVAAMHAAVLRRLPDVPAEPVPAEPAPADPS